MSDTNSITFRPQLGSQAYETTLLLRLVMGVFYSLKYLADNRLHHCNV